MNADTRTAKAGADAIDSVIQMLGSAVHHRVGDLLYMNDPDVCGYDGDRMTRFYCPSCSQYVCGPCRATHTRECQS